MTKDEQEIFDVELQIVRHIMGWTEALQGGAQPNTTRGAFWSPSKRRTQILFNGPLHTSRLMLGITQDQRGDGFVFSPMMHMPDAWQVLERMIERKYTWEADGNGNSCQFKFLDNGKIVGVSCSFTPMAAICQAALRAVGKL